MEIEYIPFSLNQVIRDTLIPLQFQAEEKNLALSWSCEIGSEELLLGDPSRMRQILTNLLGNSLKFTQKGRVSLEVSGKPDDIGRSVDVRLAVQDTGIGISKEAINKLFNPFSQADASTARMYGGTGLGLTICRDLTRLMGGEISLESTIGEGTTVTCKIPFDLYRPMSDTRRPSVQLEYRPKTEELQEIRYAARPVTQDTIPARRLSVREPEKTSPKPPITNSNPTATSPKLLILIVDDNPVNRKVNSLFMKRFGHDVAVACDGQEACDYLSKNSGKPRPTMVFMDCMMPVVDGYEATRRIRNDTEMFDDETRALPIVALTASALQRDRDRCWEAGMNDCIGRPIAAKELKAAVEKWAIPPPGEEK